MVGLLFLVFLIIYTYIYIFCVFSLSSFDSLSFEREPSNCFVFLSSLNGMKENGMQTQNSQINLHWCRIIDGKVKEKLDKSRDTRKMKVLLCN